MKIITLLDGRNVPRADLRFEPSNHRFYLTPSEDVTNLVRRTDKLTFSGFDPEKDNRRLSAEKQNGIGSGIPGDLNESTFGLFVGQLATDPLSAPLETLDNTARKILGSFGIQTMLGIALIVLFFYAGGLPVLRSWLKKTT